MRSDAPIAPCAITGTPLGETASVADPQPATASATRSARGSGDGTSVRMWEASPARGQEPCGPDWPEEVRPASAAKRYRATTNSVCFPRCGATGRGGWPSDLLAGLVLAAIAIPEQLATARLANMPPQTGLYAFIAGSLAYALIGKNRYVSVGADSTIAPIFAGSIAALAITGHAYTQYVGAVALGAGALLVIAGVLRAGWLADLLSIPVTVGFLAGISVHIIVGQLPLVLGITAPEGTLLQRFIVILTALPSAHAWTVGLGAAVFFITFASSRINARVPGALIGLALASALVAGFGLQAQVPVLGVLPAALPGFALPLLSLREALRLVPVAFIVALVCMMQTALVVRSFPSSETDDEDPGRSFGAVGLGSVVAACIGSFAVDASPPRTAVLRQARTVTIQRGLSLYWWSSY